jgi:hypothetical protein
VAALLTCRAGLLDLHARDDETTVRT